MRRRVLPTPHAKGQREAMPSDKNNEDERPSSGLSETSNRKRPRSTENSSSNADEQQQQQQQQQALQQSLVKSLLHFRTRNNSLRLSASRVAALTGFNPYVNLPEIMLDLIYQGSLGQAQLRHDAQLLGMELITRDESLRDIAQKAGPQVHAALAEVAQIKDGIKSPPKSVKTAQSLKDKTVTLARRSKNLSAREIQCLEEGVRSAVDTTFGTHYEDEALDIYEKQYGCQVRDRNAAVWSWDFAKADVDDGVADDDAGSTRTVVAMSDARPLSPVLAAIAASSLDNPNTESKETTDATVLDFDPNTDVSKETTDAAAVDLVDLTTDDKRNDDAPKAIEDERPYFSILGSIDGVRDELYYNPLAKVGPDSNDTSAASAAATTEEEQWELRPLVVECKHRMRRVYNPPPLYDQIQSCVYCLMHKTSEADLVQVVRTERVVTSSKEDQHLEPKNQAAAAKDDSKENCAKTKESESIPASGGEDASTNNSSNNGEKDSTASSSDEANQEEAKPSVETTSSSTDTEVSGKENGNESKDHLPVNGETELPPAVESRVAAVQRKQRRAPPAVATRIEINVTATRISLDDPTTQHRANFYRVILPRLRSFADAVYAIRSDDDKRYRFLVSSSVDDDQSQRAAWEMIFAECPWLRSCDIIANRASLVAVIFCLNHVWYCPRNLEFIASGCRKRAIHVPGPLRVLRLVCADRCERGEHCWDYDMESGLSSANLGVQGSDRPFGMALCKKCTEDVGTTIPRWWNHWARSEERLTIVGWSKLFHPTAASDVAPGVGPIIHARHIQQISSTYKNDGVERQQEAFAKLVEEVYGKEGSEKYEAYEKAAEQFVGCFDLADEALKAFHKSKDDEKEENRKLIIAKKKETIEPIIEILAEAVEDSPAALKELALDYEWREPRSA